MDHGAYLIAIPDTDISSAFFVMPKVSVTRPTPWSLGELEIHGKMTVWICWIDLVMSSVVCIQVLSFTDIQKISNKRTKDG